MILPFLHFLMSYVEYMLFLDGQTILIEIMFTYSAIYQPILMILIYILILLDMKPCAIEYHVMIFIYSNVMIVIHVLEHDFSY